MKSIFARSLFASFALLAGTGAFAGPSMLRIACEGEDVRAEVEINGKFRGECPLDIQVPAGTVQLTLRKKVDAEKERLFTDEFRIGDDTIKKVEVHLGGARLNASTVAAIRKGAEQGVAEAMYRLGRLYADGVSLSKDNALAFNWYRKAAGAGNSKAMASVASAHSNGRGTPKDPGQGEIWYQKAADAGSSDAMSHLYSCYKEGRCGLPKNQEMADRWIRKAIDLQTKAAQAGDEEAMFDVGVNYLKGRGVAQDNARAAQWFRRAADAGQINAMWFMGSLYENGEGVPEDRELAIQWYRKAAALGDKASIDALAAMGIQ